MVRVWALFLCLAAASGWAEQTRYEARPAGGDTTFTFGWTDRLGQPQGLRFTLSGSDLAQASSEFGAFDNDEAHKLALVAMQKRAASMSGMGREVRVDEVSGTMRLRTTGLSEAEAKAAEQEIQGVQHATIAALVSEKFYLKIDDTHIMPNHPLIAERYAPAMMPIAKAVATQVNVRDVRATTDYLMGFLQNIPYDKLDDRATSNGAGFVTPYALLAGNKGDCDSKSVALAATLRAIYPNLPIVIVYTPEHAFVGVGVDKTKSDYGMRLGGSIFVLADPVGPSMERLGEIDRELIAELGGGAFSYKVVE